jgi:hypothetical protein
MGGGSSKGGGQTQKSETTSKPPEWAQPLFEKSAADAMKLYNSDAGFHYYPGSTVADQSDQTKAALDSIATTGGTGVTNAGQTDLDRMASGADVLEGNPYWRASLDNLMSESAAKNASMFSGAGRYGSGANQAVLAKTSGNLLTDALNSQFAQGKANQFQAISTLDNRANTSLQNQFATNAAQLAGGQVRDVQAQKVLADDVARFMSEDQRDWTKLGALQAAAAGAAGNYGTQSQTQAMSGGGAGASSGLGLAGSFLTKGPGKSDRRLKENIERVGTAANGLPLYAFDYIGKPGRYVGVMAQDVLNHTPSAVVMEADGYYAVHYDVLGLRMERVA